MVFARKLAKSSANVLAAGLLRHPEQFVIIGFSCRCHGLYFVISNHASRNLSKSASKKCPAHSVFGTKRAGSLLFASAKFRPARSYSPHFPSSLSAAQLIRTLA